MAFILQLKKIWKQKLAYNFLKNFTEGKVAWLSVQSSTLYNLYNSIRVLQLTKEIRLPFNLILSTKLGQNPFQNKINPNYRVSGQSS